MKAVEPVFAPSELARIFAQLRGANSFAVAVSGGGDSMALLRMVLEWHGAEGITALTVDHHLRDNSEAEASEVARWCQDLGVAHHTLTWAHPPLRSGLQAKARVARYDLLSAFCIAHGLPIVLTAHTREDQAETVAMRKLRTKSPKSLASIWPRTQWNTITVVRPLLQESRKHLREYLTSIHQSWLEDPSNTNESFERIRIRNASPDPTLAAVAESAQAEVTAAQQAARTWASQNLEIQATGLLRFPSASLSALSPLAKDEMLLTLIALAGGAPPERARRAALLSWMENPQSQRRTLGGVIFAWRKSYILAMREPARIAAAPVHISADKPVIWDHRFEISAPPGSTISSMSSHKPMKRLTEIPSTVWAGLPVVSRRGEILGSLHDTIHDDVKIKFIKK